jgi:hypothetical protein
MAFEMSFDSSGQSFEIEDSADLDMSGGFASVLSSTTKKNAVDDPWAMNLDIPTKKNKNKKKKKNDDDDDDDEPPAWMRSSKDKAPTKKIKVSATSRADKYLKKSKKSKKKKAKEPVRNEPETLSDMEFSSDEEDRRRRKKKEKKSMRVNVPSASSGLSPPSDRGGLGGGMRRSSAQTNLGSGMGSSTLKRYQEELDERNTSPLTMGQDVKDRVSSGRNEVVRSASDLSNVVSSSNAALGNVMSFADRFGSVDPEPAKTTTPPKSKSKSKSKAVVSPVTSPVQSRTEAFGNVMSFDQLMGGGGEVEEEVVEEEVVEEREDTPLRRGGSSGGRSEALGNIRGIEDLLGNGNGGGGGGGVGGGGTSPQYNGTTNSTTTTTNNNIRSNHRSNNHHNNNHNHNNNRNHHNNTHSRSTNDTRGRPPLHVKPDPLEESITEMVEEEDELASSRSSSYGGKTPRAPKMRHPSRTNHSIDNNNSSNNHDLTRQDSIESYMNDDFEDDDEDYSVDFDNQSHSSNRVSPRAVKMQQQHHYPQDQHTKSSSSRTHGSSSSASSTRHSSRKSKTMGTQANGTKDVGCQAMMVPLPPLGYDPMLYFGAPAMMGGGMGGMMGGGMMGGGMMGGMSGMMGGGMMPPSMIRMPPPGSFYGRHPAMGPMHAWGSNNASSPGSSVAPSRSSGTTGTTGTTTGTTESSTGTAATDAANNAPTSTRNSSDMFAQQMEMSRLTFEKQLETIREHIHKTHARVAATAQAAGYQNYTTLASTQEYIRKMRKPQPLSFSEAMQTVDTKYAKEL